MVGTSFVGRAEELATLLDVARGRPGRVAAAIVVGPPGSGKSRLLAQVSSQVEGRSIIRLPGHEMESGVPLAAAAPLLRALVEVPEDGRRLSAILFGGSPEPKLRPLEPIRVFEAAHRALRVLGPTVLVVDDAQWLDELSASLLRFLLRAAAEVEGATLAVLVASRLGVTAGTLAMPLETVVALPTVTMVELEPLGLSDGIELVRSVAPAIDEQEAAELWRRAAGSPFWLQMLARGDAEANASRLVEVRLRGADADTTALLTVLALLSRPVARDDISDVQRWPGPRLDAAVRELVDRGIAIEAAGTVCITHDLIREAALAALPTKTKRRVHSRLAEWLMSQQDDVGRMLEALEHRRAANLPVVELASRLARSSQRRLLGERGLTRLQEVAEAAGLRDDAALALSERVASLASELGHHEWSLARLLLVAERRTDRREHAKALLAAAREAFELARGDQAEWLLRRAADALPDDAVVALEAVTLRAAIALHLARRTTEGRALAAQSVRKARDLAAGAGGLESLDRGALQAYEAAVRVGWEAEMQAGHTDASRAIAESRAAAARLLDEEASLAATLVLVKMRGSTDQIRHVRDEANRLVLPGLALSAGLDLVSWLLAAGQLRETEIAVAETEGLERRVASAYRLQLRLPYFRCLIALYRGDWREGLETLRLNAAAESEERERLHWRLELAHWLGRLKAAGARDEILAALADVRSSARIVDIPAVTGLVRLVEAEALARIGDVSGAERALDALDRGSLTHHFGWEPVRRRAAGALLQVAKGEVAAGADELDRVHAHALDKGYLLEAVWASLDLGSALVAVDRMRAADVWRTAAADAVELGAVTLQELAEQRLRLLGVRTWRRRNRSADVDARLAVLSAREREIARLVVAGASNPEIAERLFVSRKTVERHVSNALAKVGARNRAELAAYVARVESRSGV